MSEQKRQAISVLVADKFGVLSRIIEYFGSSGYSVDSICSGACEEEGCQRITLVFRETEKNIDKIIKMVAELVEVYKVDKMQPSAAIMRELLLAKLALKPENRTEIFALLASLEAEVIEVRPESVSFQLIAKSSTLDQFMETVRPYRILQLSRTGEAAIQEG